ncbi:MAG: hypothetical protein ACREHC_01970 [Candidatus Levyibacteriota bacterium]
MHTFPKTHVFILPHAQEYQRFYHVSLDEILLTLNEPDTHEGVSEDRYTSEKQFANRRVYIYYYLTLPLQGKQDEVYAVVDFVSVTEEGTA